MLALEPEHADAHFLLGMVALAAGDVAKARGLVERAIGFAAERADYHAQHARCLALLHRHDDARAAVARALAREPRDALTLDTLGVVLALVGEHGQAERLFASAVALEPRNSRFQYNRAAAAQFLGDFATAERAYEAALAANPRLYRAHSALAELRRQTADSNHIDRLTSALAGVGDDADGELHLRHALAKEHEDLGRYAEALAQWTIGKARKRRTLAYSSDADGRLFAKIIETFDAARLAPAPRAEPSAEPIFVIGMPRTGTTLVERILASHSAVASAGESQNFPLCVKRAAATPARGVLDEATLAAAVDADLAALGRDYLARTRPAAGRAARFVDKLPLNFFYVGLIHLALPNAKIVLLRRHPLDACLSNFRQLFALDFPYYNYAYDLADIGRYYVAFDRLMRHWHAVLPGKILEIHYERLVTEQAAQTRRLLAFCGLPWEAACLDFHANAAPVATASAVQVRQPLHRDSIGRWRHYETELAALRETLVAAGIAVEA